MKNLALLTGLLLFLVSCQDRGGSSKPKNLIPEKKMVELLTDISLLNGAKNYNKHFLEEKGIEPYTYLWEKYKVDSTQFLVSNNYYARNYKQYHRIYDSVQSKLEALRVKYDTLREREQRRKDSILGVEKEKDSLMMESGGELDSLKLSDSLRIDLPRPVSRSRMDLIKPDTLRHRDRY